ncbi:MULTISPECIES: iron-sulfur cluster assembly accessory protein [unclassified Nitrosomonas]|uniref:HesB/IscA family protein n=1 Tax=unclassified Nitrosomonas TaxID=2609265 RepID=UPI000896664C|nr:MULTISPECIES: iron-sulfur cluster assembly accessory protein [unclassified Nitrosomonas]MDV6343840.1 iron-sulfur cluster assembly accessory protein [Nitrosomonas sp. Is37]SDZ06840.1 iron-sulfur cluster assembly protein [Nitrosomonas sp. Nm33]
MAITLTERAAKQIQQQLTKRGKGLGLRIGIKKSGCSGFTYIFDYADEMKEEDQLFESHNARIVIKRDNLSYFDGSEIDFVKEGLNSTFKFNNPNIGNTCGCGESFSLKTPEESKENI